MKFSEFLKEGVDAVVGKIYNVDWDGKSIAKVTNVTSSEIDLRRIDKNGNDMPGVANQISLTKAEWKEMEPSLVKAGSKETQTTEALLDLAKQLIAELRRMPQGRYVTSRDVYDPEVSSNKKAVDAALRYWGSWENPEGAEDEEDYDWKELTDQSAKLVDKTVKDFAKKNSVKATWTQEEKEYINIRLEW